MVEVSPPALLPASTHRFGRHQEGTHEVTRELFHTAPFLPGDFVGLNPLRRHGIPGKKVNKLMGEFEGPAAHGSPSIEQDGQKPGKGYRWGPRDRPRGPPYLLPSTYSMILLN